jgi:radical SAM protein with 4Fe4S-binding SPASM domain
MSDEPQARGPSRYRDPHLRHRQAQDRAHLAAVGTDRDPLASLVTVEVNVTELCNRRCVFCPRVDPAVYPNRSLHMEVDLAGRIAADLATLESRCRISFSGFGEPLLHPRFADLVRAFRARLPANTIEVNTNGDRLTVARIRELFEAGLTYLYVNLYDGPGQEAAFTELFAAAAIDRTAWRLRPHWPGAAEDFGLTLNNRSGTVNSPDIELRPLDRPLERRCYYPFYKLLIDWNGDVLFCSNDWGREIVIGNVATDSIRSLWMSERMFEVRRALMRGDRRHRPCNRCNVLGTLHGEWSFRRLVDAYAGAGRITEDEARAAGGSGPGAEAPGDGHHGPA